MSGVFPVEPELEPEIRCFFDFFLHVGPWTQFALIRSAMP